MIVIASGTQNIAANSTEYTLIDTITETGIFVVTLDLTNGAANTITCVISKKVLTGSTLRAMKSFALVSATDGPIWDSIPVPSSFEYKVTIQINAAAPVNVDWSIQKL